MAKPRNAGIVLPHPNAWNCAASKRCTYLPRSRGEQVGTPAGWLQCVETSDRGHISKTVMESPEVALILSTGGLVSSRGGNNSGMPAIVVDGGNAPILVDELADLQTACGSLILGNTLDNVVICATEQSVFGR